MSWGHAILVVVVTVLAAGCGTSEPLHDTDRNLTFDSGAPILDVEAYPEIVDDGVRLRITWGVVRASLIRINRPFGVQSIVRTEIEAYALGEGSGSIYTRSDTLRYSDTWQGDEFGYQIMEHVFDLDPGRYEIAIRVEDRTSGASSRRTLDVQLPAGDDESPLCQLRLFSQSGDTPVVAFHVDSSLDGIDVVADSWGDGGGMELALVRVESDTTIAEPPFGLGRTGAAISVRGVMAERADTLEVREWNLTGQPQQHVIRMEPHATGVYRALCLQDGTTLASREFAVRQPGFPRVNRLDVMLDALTYLATPGEMRHIREAYDPIELKLRFDSFWAQLTPNRLAAANLLERYYSRVQQANLLFSGIKEGWKTDRGMVYIMRGPPLYIDRTITDETWYYRYSDLDPTDVFVFDRVVVSGLDAVSRHLVLKRNRVYNHEWQRLRDRWRRGEDV